MSWGPKAAIFIQQHMLQQACSDFMVFEGSAVFMLLSHHFSVLSSVAPLAAPAIGTARTAWPSRQLTLDPGFFPPAGAADILSRVRVVRQTAWPADRRGEQARCWRHARCRHRRQGAGRFFFGHDVERGFARRRTGLLPGRPLRSAGRTSRNNHTWSGDLSERPGRDSAGTHHERAEQLVELARSKPGEATYSARAATAR